MASIESIIDNLLSRPPIMCQGHWTEERSGPVWGIKPCPNIASWDYSEWYLCHECHSRVTRNRVIPFVRI